MPLPSNQPGASTDSINTICRISSHELIRVVNDGDKERLKELLTASAMPSRLVNEVFQGTYNTLSVASYHGYTDVLKVLVRVGGDLLGQDKDHRTPLFQAACMGQHITVAYILETIKESFKEVQPGDPAITLENYINKECGVNGVALYAAIQSNFKDEYRAAIVGMLIENGAEVPEYCRDEADRLSTLYREMTEEKRLELVP